MQQPALLSDQIRVQQGVYLFSALGGGVLHGAAAADHQLQMLQGPQILQRVFARHDEVCAFAGRDRAGHLANACQLRVAQGGGWKLRFSLLLKKTLHFETKRVYLHWRNLFDGQEISYDLERKEICGSVTGFCMRVYDIFSP